jgi:general secretion pathway protein G
MSHNKKLSRNTRHGFTLIEIIVVVMIIAVLATLIAPRLMSRVGTAKQTAAKAKAATIAKTIHLYVLDMEITKLDNNFELEDLLYSPEDGGGPHGPYLERADDIVDPWGNPFAILFPPDTINASFDIVSWGEDGVEGGEDVNADITQ